MRISLRVCLAAIAVGWLGSSRPAAAEPLVEFAAWRQQHESLSPSEAAAPAHVARGTRLARQRAVVLRQLLERDPARFVQQALPATAQAKLPAAVQAHVEQRVRGRGSFAVYCGLPKHDEEKQPGRLGPRHGGFEREAVIGGVTYRAFVYSKWRDQTTVGDVLIEGVALGDALAIGDTPTAAEQAATGLAEPVVDTPNLTGANTLLYMIAQFSDEVTYPITSASALTQMGNVSTFWLNNSSGSVYLTGRVNNAVMDVVFITLPQPKSYGATYNASFGTLLTHARNAALSNGYNFADYNLDVVVTSDQNFSYAGRAYVSGQGAHLVQGYTSLRTAGHELGHNIGLWHANYWRTDATRPFGKDSVPGGYVTDRVDDEWVEYGHYFSIMSAQSGGEIDEATKPHYAGTEKARLGWLAGAELGYVNSSGTYRLFRHDHRDTTNTPRAIRIEPAATDYTGLARRYWLNYRYAPWSAAQNYTRNGLQIDVAQTSYNSDGAVQLDLTPFSSDASTYINQTNLPSGWWTIDNDDKLDGTLILGRTYSDRTAQIHVTPVATGNLGTNEEYIDCEINLGTFPANHVPLINSFTASTTQTGTSQNVVFGVDATDPDGDPLSYAWDFDQAATWSAAGLNTNTATKSWAAAGQYRVQVTVSDRKGGVATESILVTIATPSNTRQIWGRVLWGGIPVYNARVSTTSAQAWTDTDGAYVLTDLPATNNLTVSCRYDGLTFTPQFSNPVNTTPENAYGKNFYANENFGSGGSGATYIIAGQVTDGTGTGVSGAEVRAGGKLAVTDGTGAYVLTNFPNGSYTVTAQYLDWSFTPSSYTVAISGANSTGNNFARTSPYSIAGRVDGPPAGNRDPAPTVYLSNGRAATCTRDGAGADKYWGYVLSNVPLGTYSISAQLTGYAFAPAGFTNPVTIATALTGHDLVGVVSNVAGAISGRLTEAGLPVSNVTVSAGAAGSALTDTDGRYRLPDLASGIYTLVPARPGYSFSPATRIVSNVPAAAVDFTASSGSTAPSIISISANPSTVGSAAEAATLAATASGADPLTFSWAATTAPGPVEFSVNDSAAATNTVVSFQAAGVHTFRLRVTAGKGLATVTNVSVVVNSGPGRLTVAPYEVQVFAGATINFSVQAWDTLGNPISSTPAWGVSGGGTIASTGAFTAGLAPGGPYAVVATDGALCATGYVWVAGEPMPVVSITSPTNNQLFAAASSIPVAANAVIGGVAAITNLTFLANGTVIGSDASSPYQVNWANAGLGAHALTAIAYANNGTSSTSATINVTVVTPLEPVNPSPVTNGVDYAFYIGTFNSVTNLDSAVPVTTGVTSNFANAVPGRSTNDYFGVTFAGYIQIPSNGVYTFFTTSDDGSRLWIGATSLVPNDGLHGSQERSGAIALMAGRHPIRVSYFEAAGGETLSVSYEGPGVSKQTIPSSALWRLLPTVSVSAPLPAAQEFGPLPGQFSIARAGNTNYPITITHGLTGTASNGLDYTVSQASVTLSAGVASASINITPVVDSLTEGAETVQLQLSPNPLSFALGSASNATVTIADLPIDDWRLNKFAANAADPAVAGDNADPDGDGLANLLEYAFHLEPLGTAADALPVSKVEEGYLTLTYRQSKSAPDLVLTVEACGDIKAGNWSSTGLVPQPPTDWGDCWLIKVRDAVPLNEVPSRFMRVRATR